jgi:oxaloacetate decarboxylase gamma subunit
MQSTLIEEGFDLMLFGMGTVFVFLLLLVAVTVCMSKMVNHWYPEEETFVEIVAEQSPIDPHIVSVIQVAIDRYRAR